jgi:uncharacterized protein YjbI with pentapeptide repeats
MKIVSLVPLALGTLMLGILMAACCIAAAQPQNLSSKMTDRAELANLDLSHMNLAGMHLNQSNLSKRHFYALRMAFKFPASRNKDGKD